MSSLGKRLKAAFGRGSAAAPKGFTLITEYDPQDIFIASYPKSGVTWFQELISAVVYGVMPEFSLPALVQDLVPDVHFKTFYQRYNTPMFFKTHSLPRPEYKRVVYLLRDGRDAMVSYFHYSSAVGKKSQSFLRMVQDGPELGPCKWHEHVKAWQANPFGVPLITIKYEDLQRDPTGELMRFCEFAGIQRERKCVQEMAEATAFDKMQSKEARQRIYLSSAWSKDKLFRRRGQAGSYKDEMPPEALAAFLADAGGTLHDCGYA
jgi:hypothetical protein